MKGKITDVFSESALWILANLTSMAAAAVAAYGLSTFAFEWGTFSLAALTVAAITVSASWGSWISLIWTRNRLLRASMKGLTLVTGLLVLTAGCLGIYTGFGSILLWALLIVSSLGTVASAAVFWRRMPARVADHSSSSLAFGLVIYPLITAVSTAGIVWLWHWFITNPYHNGFSPMLKVATVAATVLAVELTTTAIPAAISLVCQRLALDSHD